MMSAMQSSLLALTLAVAVQGTSFIYQNPAADQTIRRAMHATYSFDLAEARRAAKDLQRTHPDHPVGFVLDGETYWWEAQLDPTREQIEEQFFAAQDKAIDIGEKALKAKKYPVVEIQAYLASAWGSKARFRLTQHGISWSTVSNGRSARNYAEEVFKADPKYTDILVGIGAANYFTGKIPAVLKPLAWLLGAKGDATLGLQQLRTAMDQGRYGRTEARIVLFTALMKDGAFAESFKLLQGLMSDYPANPAFYAWATQWYVEQEKLGDGIAYFEKLHAEKLPSSPKRAQYALFQKAFLQAENDREADALATLRRLRTLTTADAGLLRSVDAMEKDLK